MIDYYKPDVVTANDFYPFGMIEPLRKYAQGSSSYRYSINGQEKSTELNESFTTAEYWEYDSRIGKRWNVDPVIKTSESSYASFNNNPIMNVDPKGLDGTPYKVKKGDNLRKLAKKAGVTGKELIFINGIKDGDKLKSGQIIELYALPTLKESYEMTWSLGNPEQDFINNQLTNYNNPSNEQYSYHPNATSKEIGSNFCIKYGTNSKFPE